MQRRAVNIIDGLTKDYTYICNNNNLPSLYERRCDLSKRFLNNNVLSLASCLHYLSPDRRENDVIAKFRKAGVYKCLPCGRTERFKHSFISYAVENYM